MNYKTSDIYISTALISNGAEFVDIEVEDKLRRTAVFVLNTENIDVESFLSLYKQKKIQVDAFTFVDTFKALKTKMYERLNQH